MVLLEKQQFKMEKMLSNCYFYICSSLVIPVLRSKHLQIQIEISMKSVFLKSGKI